ncbi:MAG: hypothetical protein QMD44_06695 [Thermodesulfovibrionales bacterium]|jgi:hypothetical protein|nr:hypothetical protein [Thermodesulfovibrionales bacterium]
MEISNRIRFYYYISGVLANQQADPLCGICKAFVNSVRIVREGIEDFELNHAVEMKSLSNEMAGMLSYAKKVLSGLKTIEDAVGQKKAGNCKMPEGVCFVKTSKAIVEKITGA